MKRSTAINCEGLSTELVLLRIKQSLMTGKSKESKKLNVSVSNLCDRKQLMQSLGGQAAIVQLV